MHHPQCLRLFATLRLRGRLGRDGCQSALWDCFEGQIWRHNENASPKTVPQCTWPPSRPGLFPRKRAPVARFTALNNLPFHHGSPAIEPCYKFPCASNRLHIAPWHWANVFCFVLYYWAARKGNFQSRITFYLCRRKTKWRTELPEGFAYPTTPLPPASMGPISAGRGRVISGRLANRFGSRFNTNTKLLRGVIGPISAPHDYRNTVFGWGS